ncbi:unnamed protein product [Protopolystoma xenopodis]|uniref:Uncharacterized protein n=1 Tax=Protopolystoma xenopodis TaxID=117903 RepID=A0A448X0S8_9PLAT|nr:unnamed protein product [Protopolystoma xenopodis]
MRRALRGRRRVRNLSSFGVNTTILFGFVICLCATSHMYHLMDELLAEYARASITENKTTSIESSSKQSYVMSLNKKAKASMLKALIRQRGLPFINAIEREITREEFVAAEKLAILDESSNNKKPDNYDYVILNKRKVLDRYSKVDHTSLTSMIFDTESLFIEQVEDNKDSVWLLAVVGEIDEFNSERPTFPPNVWGSLIKYLSGFGFRFGLLDCRLLKRYLILDS